MRHERSARLLLALLLIADAVCIALHIVVWWPNHELALFSLERDGS